MGASAQLLQELVRQVLRRGLGKPPRPQGDPVVLFSSIPGRLLFLLKHENTGGFAAVLRRDCAAFVSQCSHTGSQRHTRALCWGEWVRLCCRVLVLSFMMVWMCSSFLLPPSSWWNAHLSLFPRFEYPHPARPVPPSRKCVQLFRKSP